MKKIIDWKKCKVCKNKKIVIILIIVLLLGASQWTAVRLVYAKKVSPDVASWFARIYPLQAGKISGQDNKVFTIGLYNYLENIDFAKKYLASQVSQSQNEQMGDFQMPSDESIRDAAWRKVAKDMWLADLAKQNNLSVSDEDVKLAIEQTGSYEEYKTSIEKDLGLKFDAYERLVIRPSILESKVYKYLLDNYNDKAGMEKAQAAYEALNTEKRDFAEVAKEYSDDMTYVEQSWFVNEDELGEFAEPISKLEAGQYSQIIVTPGSPGAYIILKLIASTLDPATGKQVKELRGLAIQAKGMEEFFDEFLSSAQVQKWY
jgi:parvulin-like peptidyl-prolyl isomerase